MVAVVVVLVGKATQYKARQCKARQGKAMQGKVGNAKGVTLIYMLIIIFPEFGRWGRMTMLRSQNCIVEYCMLLKQYVVQHPMFIS